MQIVKRRTAPFVILLSAVLVCTDFAGTSVAVYRTTLGAQQCCKTHCRHHGMPKRLAEQCCRTHPAVNPAATSTGCSVDAGVTAITAHSVTSIRTLASVSAAAPQWHPPPGTLFVQHTSLSL